jgi:hypothetical protein
MLDILGAEDRFKEYSLLLHDMLNTIMLDKSSSLILHKIIHQITIDLLMEYRKGLPVSYETLTNKFNSNYRRVKINCGL